MLRVMGVTEARCRFGELIAAVHARGETMVLARHGRPAAVMIPMARFEQLLQHRDAAYQVVTDVQRQNQDLALTEDELLALASAAVHAVRGESDPSP